MRTFQIGTSHGSYFVGTHGAGLIVQATGVLAEYQGRLLPDLEDYCQLMGWSVHEINPDIWGIFPRIFTDASLPER